MAESILIVDDETPIISSLSKILEDERYEVLSATSGADALKQIATEPPDLVLLDIWMPEMDGLETLRRAREQSPTLTVMMMSGHMVRLARRAMSPMTMSISTSVNPPASARRVSGRRFLTFVSA